PRRQGIPGVSFRFLLLADLGFLVLEFSSVVFLGQALFEKGRALWPAAGGLILLAVLLWLPAMARLSAPMRLLSVSPPPPRVRSRGGTREPLAYRAAVRLPLNSLWLRIILLTALCAILGFYGVRRHGLPAKGAAFLLWSAALLVPLIDAWRALLYE